MCDDDEDQGMQLWRIERLEPKYATLCRAFCRKEGWARYYRVEATDHDVHLLFQAGEFVTIAVHSPPARPVFELTRAEDPDHIRKAQEYLRSVNAPILDIPPSSIQHAAVAPAAAPPAAAPAAAAVRAVRSDEIVAFVRDAAPRRVTLKELTDHFRPRLPTRASEAAFRRDASKVTRLVTDEDSEEKWLEVKETPGGSLKITNAELATQQRRVFQPRIDSRLASWGRNIDIWWPEERAEALAKDYLWHHLKVASVRLPYYIAISDVTRAVIMAQLSLIWGYCSEDVLFCATRARSVIGTQTADTLQQLLINRQNGMSSGETLDWLQLLLDGDTILACCLAVLMREMQQSDVWLERRNEDWLVQLDMLFMPRAKWWVTDHLLLAARTYQKQCRSLSRPRPPVVPLSYAELESIAQHLEPDGSDVRQALAWAGRRGAVEDCSEHENRIAIMNIFTLFQNGLNDAGHTRPSYFPGITDTKKWSRLQHAMHNMHEFQCGESGALRIKHAPYSRPHNDNMIIKTSDFPNPNTYVGGRTPWDRVNAAVRNHLLCTNWALNTNNDDDDEEDDDEDDDVVVTGHVTSNQRAERKWKEAEALGRIIEV